MYTCNTDYFKKLEKGKQYQAEDERTQKNCGKEIELIAIRIDGNLQRFEKSDFILQTP